jgi:hypothetical protein
VASCALEIQVATYPPFVRQSEALQRAVRWAEGLHADQRRDADRPAEIVIAVTEDPTIADFTERKAALRAQVARSDPEAIAVYAADKVAKTRELRSQLNRERASLDQPRLAQRLEHYEQSLTMLRSADPDRPFVDQLAFELWALRVLPPSS